MLSPIFERFVEQSPVTIMAQALMNKIFQDDNIDAIFEQHAQRQYQHSLLFSSLVDLMSTVVVGLNPSVNAAYREKAQQLSVSTTALYQKLAGVEIPVSQALLSHTSNQLQELLGQIDDSPPPILPGYQTKIIDGSCLAATEHRLAVTRDTNAAPLPGKALVVFDPQSKLVDDIFCCEDGYTQERALFSFVLNQVQPQDLWIADRNFCTSKFLMGINQAKAFFAIREHKSLPYKVLSDLKPIGKIENGELCSQIISITDGVFITKCRRIVLKLNQPTRNKETQVVILTNLPPQISESKITSIYRRRWNIESLFQTVTKNFNGEIKTLAYPKAALFSYSMALVTYNILASIKYILGSVHGWGKIEAGISDYYLVNEIQQTYRGMMIAIDKDDWVRVNRWEKLHLVEWLKIVASNVYLKRLIKTPRGKKKPKPEIKNNPKRPHVSTARLLRENNQKQ